MYLKGVRLLLLTVLSLLTRLVGKLMRSIKTCFGAMHLCCFRPVSALLTILLFRRVGLAYVITNGSICFDYRSAEVIVWLTAYSCRSRQHGHNTSRFSLSLSHRRAQNISTIVVLCGLRASRGSYQTCARHQTIKALVPGIDERVSAVELAFPRNETALYDDAILEGVGNVSSWGGGLVQPDNRTIENTAVIGRQEAVLFTRVGWVPSTVAH